MHLCSNWVTTRVTQGIWVIRRLRGSGRVPRVASAHLPVLDLPAAFVLGEAAPDAVHLPGLQHEREALALDQAAGTDRLGLVRLLQGLALDETGKNSSGSMDRQAASSRQGVGYLCGKGVLGVQMNSEQPLRPPGLRGLGILGPDVDEVDVQLINLGQELGKRLSSDSRRRQS